jgi:hypothetical protein
MDNCPGQNKNNHVIRLALFLVEAKYLKKVMCLFYIAGHTKNCADCWFNSFQAISVIRVARYCFFTNKKHALNT